MTIVGLDLLVLPVLADFVFMISFWVRMENSVLGNALEGVPDESEEEEQPNNSNIENANNLDGQYFSFHIGFLIWGT